MSLFVSCSPFHFLILWQRPCLPSLAVALSTSPWLDWISRRFDTQFWACEPVWGVTRVITRVFEVLSGFVPHPGLGEGEWFSLRVRHEVHLQAAPPSSRSVWKWLSNWKDEHARHRYKFPDSRQVACIKGSIGMFSRPCKGVISRNIQYVLYFVYFHLVKKVIAIRPCSSSPT